MGERWVVAVLVRAGDLVRVRGRWRRVRAARDELFPMGGPAVVLTFTQGAPWRVHAAEVVAVRRGATVIDSPSDWLLSPENSGSGPIAEMECTTCLDSSGPLDELDGLTGWCLAHARHVGHTGFRRTVTDFHRAARCDRVRGNLATDVPP
ncbi:hypothetical protein [Streptomyces sp. NPDC086023]|uniref:DUF7848 domain-containing protein n=1 Tax=Streptomyces sp. NPDC086023 TaxID=3365746 RepID=UPI0037D409C4